MAQGQLAITPGYARATAGDDWNHAFTLWASGAVKDVSTASSISAAVQDLNGGPLISATACSSVATGAAWSTGVVVLPFTAAQTAGLYRGTFSIEIQATISGAKTTWPLVPVDVQVGIIA